MSTMQSNQDTDDDDSDRIADDCGESLALSQEDSRRTIRQYSQQLERHFGGWRKTLPRSDSRSILHGL